MFEWFKNEVVVINVVTVTVKWIITNRTSTWFCSRFWNFSFFKMFYSEVSELKLDEILGTSFSLISTEQRKQKQNRIHGPVLRSKHLDHSTGRICFRVWILGSDCQEVMSQETLSSGCFCRGEVTEVQRSNDTLKPNPVIMSHNHWDRKEPAQLQTLTGSLNWVQLCNQHPVTSSPFQTVTGCPWVHFSSTISGEALRQLEGTTPPHWSGSV